VSSLAGTCGRALDLPDAAVPAAGSLAALPPVSRFVVCDGDQSSYQVSVGAAQPYRVTVTDFAAGGAAVDLSGNAAAVYKFTRPALQLVVAPQDLAFAASAVVNGATFTSGISPGGLFSVFGAGLSNATATFDGQPAKVLLSSAFQMNAQVPPDLAPGSHTLTITSPQGAMQQTVEVRETAPAIFLLGSQDDGAVVNQDGKINSPLSPIRRGQVVVIYCTGLGATETRNRLDYVKNPVTAALNGQELPVTFAGLTPGYTGLYQVNLTVPATAPPGLDLPLQLRQPGAESNTVLVSLQ
jgi:uncharacterized protein (TIGR03437 family)